MDSDACFDSGEDYKTYVNAQATFSKVLFIPPSVEKKLSYATSLTCMSYIDEYSWHTARADHASFIYDTQNLVSNPRDARLNWHVSNRLRTEYVEAGNDKGIPLEKIYTQMSQFKNPLQRRTFTIRGNCGTSYTFSPYPYYRPKQK